MNLVESAQQSHQTCAYRSQIAAYLTSSSPTLKSPNDKRSCEARASKQSANAMPSDRIAVSTRAARAIEFLIVIISGPENSCPLSLDVRLRPRDQKCLRSMVIMHFRLTLAVQRRLSQCERPSSCGCLFPYSVVGSPGIGEKAWGGLVTGDGKTRLATFFAGLEATHGQDHEVGAWSLCRQPYLDPAPPGHRDRRISRHLDCRRLGESGAAAWRRNRQCIQPGQQQAFAC